MPARTERYDDVARLFEDADLAGVHYHEFGRHARPIPVPQSPPPADAHSLSKQEAPAVMPPSGPERPPLAALRRAEMPPQQAVQAPEPASRKLQDGAAGAPPSVESLQATFSRLVARAPEPAPRKLDLGLDLPPREPAAADAIRRDERLEGLFSRLKSSSGNGCVRNR